MSVGEDLSSRFVTTTSEKDGLPLTFSVPIWTGLLTPSWNELSSICFSKPATVDSPCTPGSSRNTLADAAAGATSRSTHANTSAAQRFRPMWVAARAVRRVVMVGLVSSFGQALQIAFQLMRVRRDIAGAARHGQRTH